MEPIRNDRPETKDGGETVRSVADDGGRETVPRDQRGSGPADERPGDADVAADGGPKSRPAEGSVGDR